MLGDVFGGVGVEAVRPPGKPPQLQLEHAACPQRQRRRVVVGDEGAVARHQRQLAGHVLDFVAADVRMARHVPPHQLAQTAARRARRKRQQHGHKKRRWAGLQWVGARPHVQHDGDGAVNAVRKVVRVHRRRRLGRGAVMNFRRNFLAANVVAHQQVVVTDFSDAGAVLQGCVNAGEKKKGNRVWEGGTQW